MTNKVILPGQPITGGSTLDVVGNLACVTPVYGYPMAGATGIYGFEPPKASDTVEYSMWHYGALEDALFVQELVRKDPLGSVQLTVYGSKEMHLEIKASQATIDKIDEFRTGGKVKMMAEATEAEAKAEKAAVAKFTGFGNRQLDLT